MSLQHVSPKSAHISLSGNQLLLNFHGFPQTTRSHSSLLEMTGTVSVPRSLFTYRFDICNHRVSLMRQTWTSKEQWTNSRAFYSSSSMSSTASQLQYLPHGISYTYPVAKASSPSSQAILPTLTLLILRVPRKTLILSLQIHPGYRNTPNLSTVHLSSQALLLHSFPQRNPAGNIQLLDKTAVHFLGTVSCAYQMSGAGSSLPIHSHQCLSRPSRGFQVCSFLGPTLTMPAFPVILTCVT